MSWRRRLFGEHPRSFREHRYVYPVVSRRSRGLSMGVNLNPDKVCNFDCVYCSVDRTAPAPAWAAGPAPAVARREAAGRPGPDIDLARLGDELSHLLDLAASGALFRAPPFDATPAPLRRLADVAFSGDGEPTACPRFADACRVAARALDDRGLSEVKLVLVTNATLLDRPEVDAGLVILDGRASEIWAKLDAGTEAYFRAVDRAHTSLRHVVARLLATGRRRPLVLQSLFARTHGDGPPPGEIDAWIDRVRELIQGGCRVARVQVYTVARRAAEPWVAPLPDADLDAIAMRASAALGIPIEAHYAPG